MAQYEIIRPRRDGWLDRLKRSITLGPWNPRDKTISRYFGGGSVSAGVAVNEQTALTYSAVWAAVNLIADDVATLPLELYKVDGNSKDKYRTRPLYRLLHDKPNPYMGSYQFRRTLQANKLVWGGGFAEIERDTIGRPANLWPLLPWLMEIVIEGGRLYYLYTNPDGRKIRFEPSDIIHLPGPSSDGYGGRSAIHCGRESLGLGMAAERFGSTFFGNGSTFGGILSYPAGVAPSAQVRQENRDTLDKQHQGVDKAHRFLAIYEGAKYERIGVPPDDAQFLECVVPGTLLTMADGTRRKAEDIRSGDLIVSWGAGPVAARVAAVGRPPDKVLVKVKTARGRELVASYDHPFLTKRTIRTRGGRPCSSEPEWVTGGQLVAGNYVRVALGVPCGISYEPIPDEHAYFLGAMIGDGYIRKGACSFTTADAGVLSAMLVSVQSMGGDLRHRPTERAPYDYTVITGGGGRGGSPIRSLLNRSGAVGAHADTKRVPDLVMRGGPSAWRAFLSGYLDTDGSVRPKTRAQQPLVYFSSVCRHLLDDCQTLLAYLGVNSSIFATSPAGTKSVMGQDCDALATFGLYVTGAESLRTLASLLTPRHSSKKDKLDQFQTLPISSYRETNWKYDRVTSVEYAGCGETVGIEVEGTHTHVTAGLVTHNTRQFQVTEVARWFGVPPHKIGDLEHATYSNIEQQEQAYLSGTLEPHLIAWQQELWMKLVPPLEQNQQQIEFTREGRLRADAASRSQLYTQMTSVGGFKPNEIRALENLNPAPGGDRTFIALNMIPMDMVEDYWRAQIDAKKAPPQPPPPPKETDPTRDLEIQTIREALEYSRGLTQKAEDARDVALAAHAAELSARTAGDLALVELRTQKQYVVDELEQVTLAWRGADARVLVLTAERDVLITERDNALAEAAKQSARADAAVVARDAAIEAHAAERITFEVRLLEAEAIGAGLTIERDALAAQVQSSESRALAAEAERDSIRAASAAESLEHGKALDLLQGFRLTAEADRDAALALVTKTEAERDRRAAEALAFSEVIDRQSAELESERASRVAAQDAIALVWEPQAARLQAEATVALALAADTQQERDAALLKVTDAEAQRDAARITLGETENKHGVLQLKTEQLQRAIETALAEAETIKTDLARARADIATELDKQKNQKAAILAAMRSLFVDATERLIQKESDRARKHQATPEKLRAWIDSFYPLHEDVVRAAYQPIVGPWTVITGGAPGSLLDDLVSKHIATSSHGLRLALEADDPDGVAANLARTLTRWEHERADAMADALVREGMAG